ncbi:huntingtin [Schistocerca cancellata]|uniref:huntingtin n=1 Tax=Schistocerca cancellata TaxID=274614 RepID=UPI0021191FC3|nr:huntingtin [Schistocerca cancellata]
MATLERLVKALETLKVLHVNPQLSDESSRVKEKIAHCVTIADAMCQTGIKGASNFSHLLSVAIEILLQLCDDQHSDVRMIADESLNRIIRAMADSNIVKIQVELHKEIKKNSNPRSLRAALWRFAELCHMIRPQKGKPYVLNLVPCIIAVAQRTEESVLETLALAMPKIFKPLGNFTTDNDIKNLLKAFLHNLSSNSAVVRRTAAASILALCVYCRKPHVFLSYTLNILMDCLVPVREMQPVPTILGVLGCLRSILPHMVLKEAAEDEMRGSFGVRCRTHETPISIDRMIQVYELCLHYTNHTDHNVINGALETLHQLLQDPPDDLLAILLSSEGIRRSHIQPSESLEKLSRRSLSQMSVAPSITHGDMSLLDNETDVPDLKLPSIEKWIGEARAAMEAAGKLSPQHISHGNETFETSNAQEEETEDNSFIQTEETTRGYSNMKIGKINDDIDTCSEVSFPAAPNRPPVVQLQSSVQSEESQEESMLYSGSPSPTANQIDVPFQDCDVGSFTDSDIPLIYCARHLAASFLLTGVTGHTMPDKSVRVSVKALALSCISSIVRLAPDIILLPVDKVKQLSEGAQPLTDVLLFSDHVDPQLRGVTNLIVGNFMRSILTKHTKSFGDVMKDSKAPKNIILPYLITLLIKGLRDESSICCRHTLTAIGHCLNPLLESVNSVDSIPILNALPIVVRNSYWLVKVKLIEVVSELPFNTIHYLTQTMEFQENVLYHIVLILLGDEDARVRRASSDGIVSIIDKLFFPVDYPHQDTVTAKGAYYSNCYMSQLLVTMPEMSSHSLPYRSVINSIPAPFNLYPCTAASDRLVESSLSRMISLLCKSLILSSKFLSYGCCEALSQLSARFPTTAYPRAWNCCFLGKTNSKRGNLKRSQSQSDGTVVAEPLTLSSAGGLLATSLSLLTASPLSLDISCQTWLVQLAGNLFSGLSVYCLRPAEIVTPAETEQHKTLWAVLRDKQLAVMSEQLLIHVTRVLNVFVHVLEETVPSTPAPRPALPSLPTAPSLSPIKRRGRDTEVLRTRGLSPSKGSHEKEDKVDEKKTNRGTPIGLFASSAHYMKLYDAVKSAYTNYKITLDSGASQKFVCLLNATLETLSQLLEIATLHEGGRLAEEILSYLRLTVIIAPTATVKCVQQLLKCLFGTNLSAQWEDADEKKFSSAPVGSQVPVSSDGFYSTCFQAAYRCLTDNIASPCTKTDKDEVSTWMNYIRRRNDRKAPFLQKNFTRGSDKDSLAAYIRLFEPMVIKALKQYTVTSDVQLQCRVLLLLSQLVQLRVNYCLLDSDQIFIEFVLKQFEFIEEGQIPLAEDLIPRIFYFLVHLSYEKHHSKSIISVPKVIQLCDGLMASGQPPATHCIPALTPVVEDIFLLRGSSGGADLRELDTQREVLVSMLLRLVEYHQVLELLALVLSERESEERWRRWSRQVVDAVLPLLASGRIRLESREAQQALNRVLGAAAPSVLRPADPLLRSLFAPFPNPNGSLVAVQRWLGGVLALVLLLLSHGKEDAVLARLEELQLAPPPSSPCDPLNAAATAASCGMDPDQAVARFLLRVISVVGKRIHKEAFNPAADPAWDYLQEQFAHFLLYCIYMFESGSYCKVATAAMEMVQVSPTDSLVGNMNKIFLELAARCPLLTFLWCYLLILLGYCDRSFWASILRTKPVPLLMDEGPVETESCGPSSCVNLEVVRKGGTILYCDFVCENLSDAEQLTWLLVNHMEHVIQLSTEPPVQELIAAVHRHSTASGLLVHAVGSRCQDMQQPSQVSRLLHCLEGVHPSQSGPLLQLLATKLLSLPQLALARQAASLAARRAEVLLALGREQAQAQLAAEELQALLAELQHHRRHSGLISVLNKLASECYNLQSSEFDSGTNIIPSSIRSIVVDKNWFLAQVKNRCSQGCLSGRDSARLLSKLQYEDVLLVLSCKEVSPKILQHCIRLGTQLTLQAYQDAGVPQASYSDPATCIELQEKMQELESPLYAASRAVLLQHVAHIKSLLPRPHQVFNPEGRSPLPREVKYTSRLSDLLSDSKFWDLIFELAPGVTCYLQSLPKLALGSWPSVPQQDCEPLAKFGVICLEAINWLITTKAGRSFILPQHLEASLNCAASVIQDTNLSAVLGQTQHGSWVASAASALVHCTLHVLEGCQLPQLPRSQALGPALEDPDMLSIGHACWQMATMVFWLEHCHLDAIKIVPEFLLKPIMKLIVCLSRMPLINSYVITPPDVWRHGWQVELNGPAKTHVPPIPVEYLQDIDLLQQLIFRVTLLGWINRQQFEETWVALLSVLSMSPSENTGPEESAVMIQASSLAVQAITSLLVQTLMLPMPGNPCCSTLVHQPRERALKDLSFYQKLKAIHELLCWRLQDHHLIGPCLKLDHVFNRGNMERLNNRHRYGYSQVSIEYLWTATRILEENATSVEQNKGTVSTKCLEREQCLAASGLDLTSCLHFLLDLYTQWTAPQSGTALRLIGEAVRSSLCLSDLFTERAQFQWLLATFLELARTHPLEDDVLHQAVVIGVCKAAAVIGTDAEVCERVKKLVETALKSAFLPSRIAALHGVLYLLQANYLKGGTAEDAVHVLPLAIEYIQKHIYSSDSMSSQSEEHQLVMWALVFYLLETVEETMAETEVAPAVLQLVLTLAATNNLPSLLHVALLQGLERLVVSRAVTGKISEQVTKLAVERLHHSNPSISLPALQLLLSCMYTYKYDRQELGKDTTSNQTNKDSDPELLIQAMEKTSALFDRIKKGYPFEVELLCGVLPNLLTDFFPPSEILTKVVGEFLSPQQPHPQLLAAVVFQVFESACQQSQLPLLQEWVVLSLSNFTQCSLVGMATWCLTCFFISASTNPWLRALFPHVQSRIGKCEYEDRKLLCVAAVDFYRQLKDDKQKETFVSTFQAAAPQSQAPFSDIIACL